MVRFVRTDRGLINLDQVARVTTETIGLGPICRFTFLDINEKVWGTCTGTLEQLHHLCEDAACVPSLPGFNVLVRNASTYDFHRVPIVAWSIRGAAHTPIRADGRPEHELIEFGDGRVFDGVNCFLSLADYVIWLRERELMHFREGATLQ